MAFSTFAYYRIRGAMFDSLRKLRYALEYCDEIYIRSGAQFLTGSLPGNPLA